jgi:hypothetical protein
VVGFRTPHGRGNWVNFHHTDVFSAGMDTADRVPDAPNLWLLHCQVDDHMQAGITARYEVLPALAAGAKTRRVSAGL